VAATELAHRRLALPVGVPAVPFASLAYDSQLFCPPRQKQLFYGLGATAAPGGGWQELRAALAVRQDLEGEAVKPGAQASARLAVPLGRLVWTAAAGLDWFPASERTALELDARVTNALDLPIGGGLAFRVRSELLAFLVGGREAGGLRHSVSFGVAYDRVLKPALGMY
jgi:hypothetical protein